MATSSPADHRRPIERVVVLIPTYNERESLPRILDAVRSEIPSVDITVLDDNSPDGTGQIADDYAARDPQVRVLHRAGKEGLGRAYLHGFRWALDQGYDVMVEMDADGSHQPHHLHAILAALEDADVVIGSRWIRGGAVENWPLSRKALSVGGNLYTRMLLGMPVHDATAGYRAYRASALETIGLDRVASEGYCFQVDLTVRAVRAGLTVTEVPITFVERELGASKMSPDIARESLRRITRWGLAHRAAQVQDLLLGRERWHRL
ncbi:MAG: polyprenol monophosphomannose synthase [Actinomycetales bacterium]|nr:polyprenol monophosphomannose synthase [Tetrasphaera sp.]NLW99239.1 polyprenol monophosphomannose synthase [Actinomycetales bacterium]